MGASSCYFDWLPNVVTDVFVYCLLQDFYAEYEDIG